MNFHSTSCCSLWFCFCSEILKPILGNTISFYQRPYFKHMTLTDYTVKHPDGWCPEEDGEAIHALLGNITYL